MTKVKEGVAPTATTDLAKAKAVLASKKAPVKSIAPAKAEKAAPVVKEKAPKVDKKAEKAAAKEIADKAKADKKIADKAAKDALKAEKLKNKVPGVSDYLRTIMIPKSGTECAVTYGEANALVKVEFPKRIKLYPSEFDRNFEMLVKEGKLATKKPAIFKIKEEKVAKVKAVKEPKVKAEKVVKEKVAKVKPAKATEPAAAD